MFKDLFAPKISRVSISYSDTNIYIDVKGSSGGIHSQTIPRFLAGNKAYIYGIYSLPWRYWPYQETVRESADKLRLHWQGDKMPDCGPFFNLMWSLEVPVDWSSLTRGQLEFVLNKLMRSQVRLEEFRELDKLIKFEDINEPTAILPMVDRIPGQLWNQLHPTTESTTSAS